MTLLLCVFRKLYFIVQSGSTASLWASLLDGTVSNKYVDGLGAPTDLVVDDFTGRVYWSDPVQGTIESINSTGGDHQRIIRKGEELM